MIEEIVHQFIEAVNIAPHLLPLYAQKELNLLFKCEEKQIGLAIFQGQLKIEELQFSDANVTITGSKEALKQLLFGEDKLLLMKKRNDLSVEGRYRDLLQVEALFLLTKFRMQQLNSSHQFA
ncbi:SCP2 sterol-binding domain-containing protein [Bacillus taeanensis]|uniref:SCP2 domain-containing protein n=1 Tax=Bacillus taeanensis TaxID=273032 RepID=A0A366XXY2_9BACI|nr:SCP2 sterol-binding domain-containing protein [Bacillus taeanensis]RBW71260.1 hypothetical protein DS031_00470 [Bacillus taeanensis]